MVPDLLRVCAEVAAAPIRLPLMLLGAGPHGLAQSGPVDVRHAAACDGASFCRHHTARPIRGDIVPT